MILFKAFSHQVCFFPSPLKSIFPNFRTATVAQNQRHTSHNNNINKDEMQIIKTTILKSIADHLG